MPADALRTIGSASTPPPAGGDIDTGELDEDDEASGVADNSVVRSLIGTGDAEPTVGSGEATSVPSAEEGFNLWGPEGEGPGATAPREMASMQVTAGGLSGDAMICSLSLFLS